MIGLQGVCMGKSRDYTDWVKQQAVWTSFDEVFERAGFLPTCPIQQTTGSGTYSGKAF